MKIYSMDIAYCIVILFTFSARTLAAENGYLIGKEEDETLLNLSVIFLVMSVLFLLITILAGFVLMKKLKRTGRSTAGYELEGREDRYQSMYAGKTDHENPYGTNVVHYESLKVNGSSNGVYESLASNGTYQPAVAFEQSNGHAKTERDTPPGSANGEPRTLSSFQNPAYESSMPSGLDKAVEIKPSTHSNDDTEDTAL
ncbi:uncharacterized protein [Porites lutea]|uniref:uncharacterized protein n=1 Tax=Porites lutea TaxID=51062 RepID=UPI003CC555E5